MESLNVMVVDDSALAARKVEAALSQMGHKVIVTANSGATAIEMYEQHKPDLVTLDITMPDIDGIEVTKRILEKWQDAKIVMVTSNGMERTILKALQAGALGYVTKPIKLENLRGQISIALNVT